MSAMNWIDKIMDIVHEGILIVQDEFIIKASKRFADMLGYECDELVDMPFEDIVESRFKYRNSSILKSFLEGRTLERFNAQLLTKDDRILQVEIHPTIVEYDDSQAILAAIKDITKELTLESTVAELEDRFAVLYDLSPIAYFTLNREGIIQQANAAAEKLLGCDVQEMIGVQLSKFVVTKEPYDPCGDILREVNWGKRVSSIEIQMKRKDEKEIWVSVSAQALAMTTDGKSEIGFMAVDVTRRKAAEQRLLEERERANLYLEVMTRDLNEIYHNTLYTIEDLRTSQDLSDNACSMLAKMSWDIRRASRLIANVGVLMSLSKPLAKVQKTKLLSHINRAIREVDRDFENKTLDAKVDIPKDLEVMGHAFLWNIFFNILYSTMISDSSDTVKIEIQANKDELRNAIKIEIIDYARGIPDNVKEKMFQLPGAKTDYSSERDFSLTLVEHYITKLDGQIWIEDRIPGDYKQGSKYIILLPAWKEEIAIAPIIFYKSDHCVFCGPMLEILQGLLDELGVGRSAIKVINVDDPASGVKESDLPALPTIRIGHEELTGYIPEDELRSNITRLLLFAL